MEPSECALSAGRAVLELVEREWQPLSPGELEQRLDQAVEEILEAELMAKLKAQPSPPPPPPPPPPPHPLPPVAARARRAVQAAAAPAEEEGGARRREDGPAVKHITDLLQSSTLGARMAGRARLSLPHTVLLSLSLLCERISYRCVSRRFHLEKGNIHRIFFSFCERVNTMEERQIRWPLGREAAEALVPLCSLGQLQGVPQVLGVLGHTRIPIRLPIGKQDVESTVPEMKRMRKEAHPDSWLNLQLVCDRKGRFLHCTMSKGSDVDRGRSVTAVLTQHPELLPGGCCLVAPPGYPLSTHILSPYAGSLSPREQLFNRTLQQHFHTLQQAVANLKAQFQRLRYLDIGTYERARAVVLTACVLHNVLLDIGQVVEGDAESEDGVTRGGQGEQDDEGVQRRDAIADVLFKNSECAQT